MAEDKSVPTPTQAEIDAFMMKVSPRTLGPAPEERAKSNKEAMERMDAAVPTPTQAEVDEFVARHGQTVEEIGKPLPGEPEGPKQEREEAKRQREAAVERMEKSVPTPTQAELDTFVASGKTEAAPAAKPNPTPRRTAPPTPTAAPPPRPTE
jgi:hypothetical protein